MSCVILSKYVSDQDIFLRIFDIFSTYVRHTLQALSRLPACSTIVYILKSSLAVSTYILL